MAQCAVRFSGRTRRSLGWTLVALVVLLGSPSPVQAGAWTQREGACYGKLALRAMVGSGAYLSTGLRDAQQGIVDYVDVQLGFYAECGVSDRITALVYGAPVGVAAAGSDTAYIGPLGAGLRLDPIGDGGPTRFAIQLDYAVAPPVGDVVLFELEGASPRTFYQPALDNRYGELSVQLGHGFAVSDDVSGYVNASVGGRLPTAPSMSPALVASAQVGFTFWGWLNAEAYFPLYEPVGAELTETNISGVGQTRYLGFGVRVSAWFVESWSVFAAIDGVFYASSNAATPALQLGVETRFQAWGESP